VTLCRWERRTASDDGGLAAESSTHSTHPSGIRHAAGIQEAGRLEVNALSSSRRSCTPGGRREACDANADDFRGVSATSQEVRRHYREKGSDLAISAMIVMWN
jgi:hypothetical protein